MCKSYSPPKIQSHSRRQPKERKIQAPTWLFKGITGNSVSENYSEFHPPGKGPLQGPSCEGKYEST